MDARFALAYLVFGTRRPQRWARLLGQTLGLPPAEASAADAAGTAGGLGFRLDDACQRLVVAEDTREDLTAIGFDAGDDAALDRLAQRLRRHGLQPMPGSAALCHARRVRRLVAVDDPAGNRLEFVAGLEGATQPYESPVFGGGFRTGALGLGHAALIAHDLPAMERFYVDALGFGVSERLKTRSGPLEVDGLFLHCNARHHSIALLRLPLKQRLHHFMLQAERLADVGVAFERVQRDRHPLSLALGQHPDPDGTFSFYAATPSGFDFEIGYGSREIDPAAWRELPSSTTSSWGHRPSARLQLKMAGAVVAQWWRGGPAGRRAITP